MQTVVFNATLFQNGQQLCDVRCDGRGLGHGGAAVSLVVPLSAGFSADLAPHELSLPDGTMAPLSVARADLVGATWTVTAYLAL